MSRSRSAAGAADEAGSAGAAIPVGGPFAEALARGRERYNARFAQARLLHRTLAPEAFANHLTSSVAPVVEAVAATGASDEALDGVCQALYDLSLELVARGFAGSGGRAPAMGHLWAALLPRLAGLLVGAPREEAAPAHDLPAALANAVLNLSAEPTVDAHAWLDGLGALLPEAAAPDELLRAGMVLAWRLGMAHYRESALAVWRSLREPLQRATLGVSAPAASGTPLAVFADPWLGPMAVDEASAEAALPRRLELVTHVGGFRGFGGPFDAPPELMQVGGTLFAFDNSACWSLHADHFGATLCRFGPTLPEGDVAPSPFALDPDGTVSCGGAGRRFAELAGASSHAGNAHMLAVATPRHHRVLLVARVAAAATSAPHGRAAPP